LSRREALTILGAIGAASLAACAPSQSATQPAGATAGAATATLNLEAATATALSANPTAVASAQAQIATVAVANATVLPSCIVRPAMTEGPYFVDEKLNRADIRPDPTTGAVSAGVPLQLTMRVSSVQAAACTALPGAQVDIWHCDADGVYSDVQGSAGTKFLRGYQLSDANGLVTFTTIYPGWYQGRAVHIHFKIRSGGAEFTSQLFFDDTLTAEVFAKAPYASRGDGWLRNTSDGIFRNGGDQLMLAATPKGDSYEAAFDIGLQS
jgi:protocatechuate 3,4-dioxygenase beta subunit